MEERDVDQFFQESPHQTPLRQQREDDRHLGVNLPWWRSTLVGYILCPFLIGTMTGIELLLQRMGLRLYTPGATFYLVNVIIALLWGVRPALLAIVLGYFALDIFVVPPFGIFTFNDWSDVVFYLPFIVTQLLVVLITIQCEKARQRSLATEQNVRAYAQTLAQSNYRLEQLTGHLQELNQLKDYFLSQASHELKTPITTIRGQTQLVLRRITRLQQAVPEELSLPTYLTKIESQTRYLQVLVEDLLNISSLASGKIPLRLTQCNLGSLCREVVEDQRALTGRDIELELPAEPVMLQADCQRLTQVIINLVTNAVKYSPENTVILVCISQESSHNILSVHNDGSVIPQEQQLAVFEPFYRTPEVTYSSVQGWGLGLSISKEIVELHGGQIWVESSEGKGTTFFVQLPVV
jgi:signal transduction histidine kinase